MKQLKMLLLASMVMLFTACGGGSSSESSVVPVPTGIAYYIDSAVSGVNYTCGSQKGITKTDGSFTFEVGQSCTFYLGEMKLRGVDAVLLFDGENVYETDVNIARILQSLDSDGNLDNGITISEIAIKALADKGITKFPMTDNEMNEMLEVIENNGGIAVSEENAAAHMLATLLSGKTFYNVGKNYRDSVVHTELKIFLGMEKFLKFSPADAMRIEMIGELGDWGTDAIRIEGNKLILPGKGYATLIGMTAEYLLFHDFDEEGNANGTRRFYFEQAKAEAYFTTLGGGSSTE